MNKIDPRIVRVGIEVSGQIKYYEGLDIHASGMKFANPMQNECTVTISNIDRDTRNYILTETSPFNKNRTPKRLILEAGRESYGAAQIYVGDITESSIAQPPDIKITLKSRTGDFQKGNVIARDGGAQISLRNLSEQVAADIGATLDFQATDKTVSSYSYTGAALKQMNRLSEAAPVDVYLDGNIMVVKNTNVPLSGRTRILNKKSGLIGIPETTERGVKARFLLDNLTKIGGGMTIESELNPAINGDYAIYKLGFEISSRSTPFYWIAEGTRL